MKSNLIKLWNHLPKNRRLQSKLVVFFMIVASFAEMVSIGSVVPFLGILTSPEALYEHKLMQPMIRILGVSSADGLLLPITTIFITLSVLSGVIRLVLLYLMTRLSYATGGDLSVKMYKKTLYQKYSVHLERNSSQLINGITNKTNIVINEVLMPIFVIVSSILIMTGIMIALFMINFTVAIVSFVGFGGVYWITIRVTKKYLLGNGKLIALESTRIIKFLQEGLGGVRDILIDGSQSIYVDLYRKSDVKLRRATGTNRFISMSPKFIVESLGMVMIALLAYYINQTDSNMSNSIPILGALALGAQRLLPILQGMYSSISTIRGSFSSLKDVVVLLDQKVSKNLLSTVKNKITFNNKLELKNVYFNYKSQKNVLNNINLTINKNENIGVVGLSGSGKSTLIDIIMSLLFPSKGEMLVGGVEITEMNYRSWQTKITHVPQNIFLTDGALSENIAFGVPVEDIDFERVKYAIDKSLLTSLVDSWPDNYNTHIGERGVRISGGQRQRIGIARIFYRESFEVLVLDEATSSLDNETEAQIMDNIFKIGREITIIIIAHRVTTLKFCDKIYQILPESQPKLVSYESLKKAV